MMFYFCFQTTRKHGSLSHSHFVYLYAKKSFNKLYGFAIILLLTQLTHNCAVVFAVILFHYIQ
jgi:hypothetical protein